MCEQSNRRAGRLRRVWALAGALLAGCILSVQVANAAGLPQDSPACLREMEVAIQDIAAQRYDNAVAVVQRHAGEGCAQAQLFLGLMYVEADGVPQDCAKGIGLVQSLADRFYGDAQLFLGRLHEHGRCRNKDIVAAYQWYAIAASHPLESPSRVAARDLRINKQTLLSDTEIERGDAAAIGWWKSRWK